VGKALVVALAATATATAAPAAAQSERHPRPPVDAEAEAEARSEFWEEVVRPGARRYQHLVDAATDILRMRVGDFNRAREMLLEATALRGDLVDGWGYLGVAAEKLATVAGQSAKPGDWRMCADAYGKAFAIAPTWRPQKLLSKSDPTAVARTAGTRPLELGWATCLARAGDIDRATEALEALVARGEATGESWLRLGEVYMAAGRLSEAITALEQARSERLGGARPRWLLAMAYDRARRPGEADAIAADAGDIASVTRRGAPSYG
jgi:predicted Zn-dependent protease